MTHHRRKIPIRPGLSPGTLAVNGAHTTGPVRITVIDYDEAHFSEKRVENVEDCFPFRDTGTVTWINIDGLGNTEVIERIGKHYHIHPLILEDVLNTGQRPKMEDYGEYLFVVMKALSML